jgi:hypothetical protein
MSEIRATDVMRRALRSIALHRGPFLLAAIGHALAVAIFAFALFGAGVAAMPEGDDDSLAAELLAVGWVIASSALSALTRGFVLASSHPDAPVLVRRVRLLSLGAAFGVGYVLVGGLVGRGLRALLEMVDVELDPVSLSVAEVVMWMGARAMTGTVTANALLADLPWRGALRASARSLSGRRISSIASRAPVLLAFAPLAATLWLWWHRDIVSTIVLAVLVLATPFWLALMVVIDAAIESAWFDALHAQPSADQIAAIFE